MIGSEKESTASQIKFLQSIDFDEEDWLIATHDAEVINLIHKLFSHGTQFCYCLYTRWATKTQGDIMVPFITWPLIRSKLAQVAANEQEAAHDGKCKFDDIMDEDSMQVMSSLMNLHNASLVT